MITQKRLKEVLNYDPDTGIFTWILRRSGVKYRSVAGSSEARGYLRVRVDGDRYLAHRLAFLYMNGAFPPDEVDHINGVTDDNRWSNLRPATHRQNQKNKKTTKGYSFDVRTGKYQAFSRVNGRCAYLGRFKTKLAATYAYHVANLEVWT